MFIVLNKQQAHIAMMNYINEELNDLEFHALIKKLLLIQNDHSKETTKGRDLNCCCESINRVYNGVYSVTGETDERISDLCC